MDGATLLVTPAHRARVLAVMRSAPLQAVARSSVGQQHEKGLSGRIMSGRDRDVAASDDVTALLVRVGAGDEPAFAELYERVAGWVYGLALRVVRNPSLSEEVAQEILVDVWRHAPQFDPERGSAKAWILTIAHRRAVDRVRSEQASAQRDVRAGTYAYAAPHDDVIEQVEINLDRQRVRHLLAGLTDVQRQAIALAYFDGYSQSEIARMLNLPLGTVKTRMRDGLIRLREAMGVP